MRAVDRIPAARVKALATANVWLLTAIIISGAAVRLTGSGLGCATWPRCNGHQLTATMSLHPLIEFGNRILTTALFIVLVANIVIALTRTPHRRDLRMPAAIIVGGFVADAVVGGLVTLSGLNPLLVSVHFLVSIGLIAAAVLFRERLIASPGPARPAVRREVTLVGRAVVGLLLLVIVVGTLVTGAGPNSGAVAVHRLPIALREIAQLHADLVMLLVGLAIALALALRLTDAPAVARQRSGFLLAVLCLQAAIGFSQYALGLPPLMVAAHVAGASILWTTALFMLAALVTRPQMHVASAPDAVESLARP
jgi:heme a synthase